MTETVTLGKTKLSQESYKMLLDLHTNYLKALERDVGNKTFLLDIRVSRHVVAGLSGSDIVGKLSDDHVAAVQARVAIYQAAYDAATKRKEIYDKRKSAAAKGKDK